MLNVKQPPKWYQAYRWFIVGLSIPIFAAIIFVLYCITSWLDSMGIYY